MGTYALPFITDLDTRKGDTPRRFADVARAAGSYTAFADEVPLLSIRRETQSTLFEWPQVRSEPVWLLIRPVSPRRCRSLSGARHAPPSVRLPWYRHSAGNLRLP